MQRLLPYALVSGILIATGFAHGVITDRWSAPPDLQAEAAALARLPSIIDDWDGTPTEADENQLEVGEGLLRRYVNRIDGSAVTVFLAGGRRGEIIADHCPESCYPGAGFQFSVPMAKYLVAAGPSWPSAQFWVATFSKTQRAVPVHYRVFWSRSGSGDWQAPDYPRVAFARYQRLYKVYVIRRLLKPEEPLEGDPAIRFIQVLLPELKKALFTTS